MLFRNADLRAVILTTVTVVGLLLLAPTIVKATEDILARLGGSVADLESRVHHALLAANFRG